MILIIFLGTRSRAPGTATIGHCASRWAGAASAGSGMRPLRMTSSRCSVAIGALRLVQSRDGNSGGCMGGGCPFFVVAAFQAALVFGAPWGEYTQGGGTSGALAASGRVLAAISCVLLIVMAGAILARAREGPLRRLPARGVTVLAWVAMVYAAVAVVLNIITRSTAERNLWAPVSIVLLLLVAIVMVTTRRTS